MRRVRYAPRAELDLDEIAAWTQAKWGEAQVSRYLDELEDCCERLAENPALGRPHRGRRAGVRRMEQGSHVIFFEKSDQGILVGRILHKAMLPAKQGL